MGRGISQTLGLENQFAEDLDPALVTNIQDKCKEIYRLLTIDGYARIDLRLTPRTSSISSRRTRIPFSPTTKTSRLQPENQGWLSATDRANR
jgi:hypothetical protein